MWACIEGLCRVGCLFISNISPLRMCLSTVLGLALSKFRDSPVNSVRANASLCVLSFSSSNCIWPFSFNTAIALENTSNKRAIELGNTYNNKAMGHKLSNNRLNSDTKLVKITACIHVDNISSASIPLPHKSCSFQRADAGGVATIMQAIWMKNISFIKHKDYCLTTMNLPWMLIRSVLHSFSQPLYIMSIYWLGKC